MFGFAKMRLFVSRCRQLLAEAAERNRNYMEAKTREAEWDCEAAVEYYRRADATTDLLRLGDKLSTLVETQTEGDRKRRQDILSWALNAYDGAEAVDQIRRVATYVCDTNLGSWHLLFTISRLLDKFGLMTKEWHFRLAEAYVQLYEHGYTHDTSMFTSAQNEYFLAERTFPVQRFKDLAERWMAAGAYWDALGIYAGLREEMPLSLVEQALKREVGGKGKQLEFLFSNQGWKIPLEMKREIVQLIQVQGTPVTVDSYLCFCGAAQVEPSVPYLFQRAEAALQSADHEGASDAFGAIFRLRPDLREQILGSPVTT